MWIFWALEDGWAVGYKHGSDRRMMFESGDLTEALKLVNYLNGGGGNEPPVVIAHNANTRVV